MPERKLRKNKKNGWSSAHAHLMGSTLKRKRMANASPISEDSMAVHDSGQVCNFPFITTPATLHINSHFARTQQANAWQSVLLSTCQMRLRKDAEVQLERPVSSPCRGAIPVLYKQRVVQFEVSVPEQEAKKE